MAETSEAKAQRNQQGYIHLEPSCPHHLHIFVRMMNQVVCEEDSLSVWQKM
jgi:hypothetical protein